MILLLGCAPEPIDTGEAEAVVDQRLSEADFDAADVVIWASEVVIEPGEDVMHCIAGTYAGPDVGIHSLNTWQGEFGHHLQFFGLNATEVDYPEGESFACGTGTAFDMTDTKPVGVPTSVHIGGEQTIDNPLREGMAFSFDSGDRYLLQAHYVNTGNEAVRVHDVVTFDTLNPAEVTIWAAPIITNNANIHLPAGESASMSFDCTVPEAMNVLFANGHMHEWGTSFRLAAWQGEQETVLSDVPIWESQFRDSPPTTYFGDGEVALEPGDVLRTECAWLNTTDEIIEFPHEMCDGVGLGYPLQSTWICDSSTGMNP